jgi:hypothetical protein
VIPAGGHHQLEDLVGREVALELGKRAVGHAGGVMKLVGERDYRPLALGPHRVVRVTGHGRGELVGGEPHGGAEEGGVNAPLILGAAARAGAIDHHLSVARLEQPVGEDAGAERPHPPGQRLVDDERAE